MATISLLFCLFCAISVFAVTNDKLDNEPTSILVIFTILLGVIQLVVLFLWKECLNGEK